MILDCEINLKLEGQKWVIWRYEFKATNSMYYQIVSSKSRFGLSTPQYRSREPPRRTQANHNSADTGFAISAAYSGLFCKLDVCHSI